MAGWGRESRRTDFARAGNAPCTARAATTPSSRPAPKLHLASSLNSLCPAFTLPAAQSRPQHHLTRSTHLDFGHPHGSDHTSRFAGCCSVLIRFDSTPGTPTKLQKPFVHLCCSLSSAASSSSPFVFAISVLDLTETVASVIQPTLLRRPRRAATPGRT
ncbi:hypothetical protein HDK77DRAFT_453393 [Phyllosticta capitalensis]